MRIDIDLGTLEILLGKLYCVFNCRPTPFSEFGYTIVYWNGKPIWYC